MLKGPNMWVSTQKYGNTPKSYHFNRVWNHYFHHPFFGGEKNSPYFWFQPGPTAPFNTSVFSDAKLDLVFSMSSSAYQAPGGSGRVSGCHKTETEMDLTRRMLYTPQRKKKTQTGKFMEIYQNSCKISTTGRFGSPFIC